MISFFSELDSLKINRNLPLKNEGKTQQEAPHTNAEAGLNSLSRIAEARLAGIEWFATQSPKELLPLIDQSQGNNDRGTQFMTANRQKQIHSVS